MKTNSLLSPPGLDFGLNGVSCQQPLFPIAVFTNFHGTLISVPMLWSGSGTMTKYFLIGSSATNALFTIGVQVIALVSMAPSEYGVFSLLFLFYGLGLSISHSFVIDVWVRNNAESTSWRTYASALFWFAMLVSLLALGLAIGVTQSINVASAVAVGVGAGIYRNGARFYAARLLSWRHVILPDVLGCTALAIMFFALAPTVGAFSATMAAWATSQFVAALSSKLTRVRPPRILSSWISDHWVQIRNLWFDSTLLDVSVIATPVLMSGFMNHSSFGVYRAISSAALPVRLLLTPLRPNISNLPLGDFLKRRTMLIVLGTGAAMGVLVLLGLTCVRVLNILPDSVLPHVADFAVPAGIFTFGTLVSNVYYVAARSNLDLSRVKVGRLFETVVMIVGPISGLFFGATAGAVWLFALSATLAGFAWLLIVRRSVLPVPRAKVDLPIGSP